MLIKHDNKYIWQDEEKPKVVQQRINEHLGHLKTCKIVECQLLGECYETSDNYWKFNNLNEI